MILNVFYRLQAEYIRLQELLRFEQFKSLTKYLIDKEFAIPKIDYNLLLNLSEEMVNRFENVEKLPARVCRPKKVKVLTRFELEAKNMVDSR